jgi:hypothetical protein
MSRWTVAASLALLSAVVWPAPALAACKIAAAGGDLTLTVAIDTDPGGRLEVDWGDGTSSRSDVLGDGVRKTALTHVYAAPGTYQVEANDTGPAGCGTEIEARIPYDSGDDAKSQDVLPPPGPPIPTDAAAAPMAEPGP